MDWSNELAASALWLLQAFVVASAGFVALMWVLARTTAWGRQFWALTGAYFSPRRDWRPLAMVAVALFLSLFAVRLNVIFSYWYNGLYNSFQALDVKAFWLHITLFVLLASIHVVRALVNAWLRTALAIHWRTWLNEHLVADWLDSRAYYLARFSKHPSDNPEQRIQEDVTSLTERSISLSLGLVEALVSIVSFTIILWALSGPLAIAGLEVPRAMVLLVYAYVLVATVFAVWIGRPLIRLNFLAERFAASYRYLLIRVREYAESIALYRGEANERTRLTRSFHDLIGNTWALLWRNLKFQGYNLSVSQIGVLFPLLVQGPRVFTGAIKLGDLMQTLQAFNQVQDALSFFREAYDGFAQLRAVIDRLTGFRRDITDARALPMPQLRPAPALAVQALTVQRPDGQLLLRDLNFELVPGERLLIRGPSGAGKTTLLRTLAGLWPFADGSAARPDGTRSLFLAQKPYLPVGTLLDALAWPAEEIDRSRVREVLETVLLGHLGDQLDLEQDWSNVLSPGEQQRLAFGRAMLLQPDLVFLDEATSATDTGLEYTLYTTLRSALPRTSLVSVGHRETLEALHDRTLQLDGKGGWEIT